MRLIDADRLNSIMQNVEQYFRQAGFSDDSTPLNICKMIVEAVLNKSPTVDAVPLVHARWNHDGPAFLGGIDWYRCSSCGNRDAAEWMKYCPTCGAKMDLNETEE